MGVNNFLYICQDYPSVPHWLTLARGQIRMPAAVSSQVARSKGCHPHSHPYSRQSRCFMLLALYSTYRERNLVYDRMRQIYLICDAMSCARVPTIRRSSNLRVAEINAHFSSLHFSIVVRLVIPKRNMYNLITIFKWGNKIVSLQMGLSF